MKKLDCNYGWKLCKKGEENSWKQVNLPHDAMLYEQRDADCRNGKGTGYFPGGSYVYTKELEWREEYRGKEICFEFEGVYQNATVFLNGQKMAFHPYGYTGFFVTAQTARISGGQVSGDAAGTSGGQVPKDAAKSLDGQVSGDAKGAWKEGESNELRVEVDNVGEPVSRWYCGSGIYRPVWMHVGEEVGIEPDGVQVTTVELEPKATIHVRTLCYTQGHPLTHAPEGRTDSKSLLARSASDAGCPDGYELRDENEIRVEIWEQGKMVAQGLGADVDIEVPDARPWSEEHPFLYECRVSLFGGEGRREVLDTQSVMFGIRKISWGDGLFINGVETKLRGACIHHDNGVLGACEYPQAARRRVKILKEAGFNAVRMAHNPASKAFLSACDELGLYVMDEFVDMWYEHKNRYDYASYFQEWHEKDLAAMVRTDISHPSVIMYSIGNEVTETSQEPGIALTREMTEFLHKLDHTRPVTCGINMSLNVMNFAGMGVYKPEPDEPVIDKGRKNPRALQLLKEMMPKKDDAGGNGLAQMAAQGTGNPLDDAGKGAVSGDGKSRKLVGSEYFNQMMMQMKEQQERVVCQEVAKVLSEEAYSYLDIAGYNYANARYRLDKEEYPNRVSVGSETLPQKIYRNWKLVEELPYIIGDFMWTGWDYLGEAGIGAFCYDSIGTPDKAYPFLLANSGVIDILGNPRPEVWLNKAAYGLSKAPYIGVEPVTHADENHTISAWRYSNAVHSWSWEGCEGKRAKIIVYADAAEVELSLNGVLIGRKRVLECQVHFETAYQPGELTAVAYAEDGTEQGRDTLVSAGVENCLTVHAEKKELLADGQDLCYVDIGLTDEKGIVKASQDTLVTVLVEGAATLAGFGSAAPCTEETFTANQATTYYGKALAVVRAGYEPGEIKIKVSADGYGSREILVTVQSGMSFSR
jgi:beta-galactosidase